MLLYGFWRSQAAMRVRIALNLKGLAYEEQMIDLLAGEQFADSYLSVNAQAVVPALIEETDAESGERPLIQSLAIMEYLDETHPKPPLLPAKPRDRARVRALAQIVASDAHPLLVPRIRAALAERFGADPAAVAAWGQHWIGKAMASIEALLEGDARTGAFCHGDAPTIADISLYSLASGAQFFSGDLSVWPNVARIVARCSAEEAFASAHPLRQPGAPLST